MAVSNFGKIVGCRGLELWMAELTYESMGKAMVLAQKSEAMMRAGLVKYIFFQLCNGDFVWCNSCTGKFYLV